MEPSTSELDKLFEFEQGAGHLESGFTSERPYHCIFVTIPIVVVVVVFFTLTDRASTILSHIRGCQSDTWSQRGTKVNGSRHGDNPLCILRPTGIQIATKSYATLQAMMESSLDRLQKTRKKVVLGQVRVDCLLMSVLKWTLQLAIRENNTIRHV